MGSRFAIACWLIVGVASFSFTVGAQTNVVNATFDDVVVRKFDKALPEKEDDISKFIWDNFANMPEEEKFQYITNDGWEKKFRTFEKALVRKAKEASMDYKSLMRVLDAIYDDAGGLPSLPVGAYSTTQKQREVWIIVVKWEAIGKKPYKLSHVRIFAFDAKTTKLLGFVTCG
jgi:hypothetical protein